jgi:hypothetical protein
MSKTFTYSVLKYVHSQFLGEELNLGIILFFPDQHSLIFRHPKSINRFRKAYKNFTESAIRQYLKSFEEKAKLLSKKEVTGKLEDILQTFFLVRDASTLQFDEVKSVVLYTDDIQTISDHYFNLYFPEQELLIDHIKPITDHQITVSYKNLLFEHNDNLKKFISEAVELRNEKAHFKSDLAWKNGTLNAVKGISFDLKEEGAISDKALLINAKLNYLQQEAFERNIRFDLLVSPPKQADLLTAYDKALYILSDIKANKKIVTQDQLFEYASFTAREIER